MGILSSLFGIGTSNEKIQSYIRAGAIIIDVRTKDEFRMGHIDRSINIPLKQIENDLEKIRSRNKKVITCCRSGARSSAAARILKGHGIDTVNGGGWNELQKTISMMP